MSDIVQFLTMSAKTQQIQIRVTPEQKAELRNLARAAGQDVSTYVLSRAMPAAMVRFGEIVRALRDEEDQRFNLAELNDLLSRLTGTQLTDVVDVAPRAVWQLSPLIRNYVTAMVELAAHQRGVSAPRWVGEVAPLEDPYFATPLRSLRLHLLKESPVPFRRRNIYVDSAVGDRV